METPYKILINMQMVGFAPRILGEYEPEDPLIQTWEAIYKGEEEELLSVSLEKLFAIHNDDGRPDGQVGPSLSVSDVVIFGETAWSVAQIGFREERPPFNIIDVTWTAYMKEFAV